ncbi:MAG TPA: PAS domain S-box protein [Pyrinomonadaceae bacterium]|nr:PAS domain S-box protein [Pyrinomonadaceae bacterium]
MTTHDDIEISGLISQRAQSVFEQHQRSIYVQTDRMFAVLMVVQWLACVGTALWLSPKTWLGQSSQIHIHVWSSLFLGGAITAFPVLLAVKHPGQTATRHIIAVSQMLMSSLLIHFTGGRIETHFHVFGSLAFISFYRDWRVLVPATLVVAGDHFLRGVFWPQSVFGVLTASHWRWLEHAGWVIFEDIFLTISCLRSQKEMREIAERTAQLDASEARYRSVVEQTGESIFICDPQTKRLLKSNAAFQRLVGYDREEILKLTVHDFLLEPEEVIKQKTEETLTTRRPFTVERRYRRKDGSVVDVEHTVSVITYDGKDAFCCNARDISERKRIEEAIRKSEEYRNLFKHANDAIMIYEPTNEIILDVNDKACETYGIARDAFIGRRLREISMDNQQGEQHVAASLSQGAYQEFETVHFKADGTPIDFLVNSSIIEYQGSPAVLSINRKITERKKLEEQLRQSQKMESIGTLAGGVAHDFNNLLTIISGNIQLASRGLESDAAQARRLAGAAKAADKAATLTNQLLAFSRRQQLERRTINLNETITDMMKMLGRLIGENIAVQVEAAPDLSPVFVDTGQIEQVIMNLALNARDAMPNGGRLLIETHEVTLDENYCSLHAFDSPGRYVRLMVSDTGCGMNSETLARAFEPFFTTKEVGRGTGLGLSMVYGIIKQHEGLVEVYSEPGHGTTFKIYLPVSNVIARDEDSKTKLLLPTGTETILIAEDEAGLRELTQDVLEGLGYKVILAEDGEAALELYRAHYDEVDLIILDIVMPRIGGPAAYEQMRSLKDDVPVIFMTGYSEEMAHNMFIEETGAALIQKPYSIEILGQKVREALDGKGALVF